MTTNTVVTAAGGINGYHAEFILMLRLFYLKSIYIYWSDIVSMCNL